MDPKEKGLGRARGGRGGRGVAPPPGEPQRPVVPERPGSSMSANGSSGDEGAGPVARGRGGLRNTIPTKVKKGPGDIGDAVDIMANYFELKVSSTLIVHDYHISFEPQVESIKARRAMIYENRATFGDSFLFDGTSNLKMTKELQGETVLNATNAANQVEHKITVKYIAPVPWHSPEMMRLFNIQVRRNFQHLHFTLIGRHFFDPKQKRDVPGYQVELWPGYATAVAHHDAGILMVVDNVTKFLRKEIVLSILRKVFQEDRNNFHVNARKQIANSIVMTTYNNRTYKVDDVDFEKNPLNYTFEHRGQTKNLIDFYKEVHQIEIRDPKQPLLTVLPSERDKRAGRNQAIYLIPELCCITGMTDQMRQDFRFMKEVANCSKLDPNSRVQNLNGFIKRINQNPKVMEDMAKWDMKFDENLIKLKGRLLPNEPILVGNQQKKTYVQPSGDFSKEIRGTTMFEPASLGKWAIIHTVRDAQLARDFAETMNRVSGPMGFVLRQPRSIGIENDRAGSYLEQLRPLAGVNVDMVVCILSNNNKDRYDAIKKFCCCEAAIPSQCLVAKTLSKKPMLMSVCTKVAIQMASKVGAQPWGTAIPSRGLMVIGYDTYHDSSQKGRSVGGFVSSLNPDLTSWWSRVSYHQDSNEMSSHLVAHVKEGLNRYLEKNKRLPDRLIIYRDGVSDGYINHVYDFEMLQIKKSLKENFEGSEIRLAFIIVTKRMNTRFFARGNGPGGLVNPICGTVIDDKVTDAMRHEFYLVSQSVRQGTVAPTRYNIIEDETNLKIGHHQQLAFKLTHLYYNWPGTIRVPAPCQYAHKLAYLVGTHLHREPHSGLSNRLFYL